MISRKCASTWVTGCLCLATAFIVTACSSVNDTDSSTGAVPLTPKAAEKLAEAARAPKQTTTLFESPGFDSAMATVIKDKPATPKQPPTGQTNSGSTNDNRIASLKAFGQALIKANAQPVVTIETTKGTFAVKIEPKDVPITAGNFIALAAHGFYNGLTFHRVEPGFVIQGGDPQGTGQGGPGYTIPDEKGILLHDKGVIAMAKSSAPNSAGSQFYITLGPAHQLDSNYTVFGKVIKGQSIPEKVTVGTIMKNVTVSGVPANLTIPNPVATVGK